MLKYHVNLQNADNVAAGKTARIKADIGPRYHTIVLDYKESGSRVNEATMESSIEEIVVKLNTIEQWRITPAQLFTIERANDPEYSVSDGLIPLRFSNRVIEGLLAQELTAIGTLGVNSLEIEVRLAAGATSPTLEAYAEVDDMSEAPGIIRKLQNKPYTISSTGDFKEVIMRRGVTYNALHFFETSNGDVDNIRFQYEGKTLVDHEPDVLNELIKGYGYSPESAHIMLPFAKGITGDALPSQVKDGRGNLRDASQRLTLTIGNAQDVTMVEDFLSTPDA